MCFGALSFFTVQLTVGYHAIYNVEWLGWDIVEPLTYTVSQGLMIGGLFWLLRVKNRQEILKGEAQYNTDKYQPEGL